MSQSHFSSITLRDRVVLITGATSGVGKETAIALAKMHASLILPVRNRQKGEALKKEILETTPETEIHIMEMDLLSLRSVRKFVEQFQTRFSQLDILINNAGLINAKLEFSEDGFESTFATNHLGHFLLTELLIGTLRKTADSGGCPVRIINVSSQAHRFFKLKNLTQLNLYGKQNYTPFKTYCYSKLVNVMFTSYLADEVKDRKITVNSLHPGIVASGFGKNQPGLFKLGVLLTSPLMVSAKRGAENSVFLSSSKEVENVTGKYFVNKKPSCPSHLNLDLRDQLMDESFKLVKPYLA